ARKASRVTQAGSNAVAHSAQPLLELRANFECKPLECLLIEGRWKIEVEAAVVDAKVKCQALNDLVRRAYLLPLVLPATIRPADPRHNSAGLGLRLANHGGARQQRPFDIVAISSGLLAPAAQDLILVTDCVDVASDVPDVGIASYCR